MKPIKYLFTILLAFFISGLSFSFQNCNVYNQSEKAENDFLRVFTFFSNNEKQVTKTYLSLKGQLKDDKGKPLINALMSLNASGISSNQQRANTRAGTSSIRCADYDLKKSNAQCFKIIKPDLFTKKSVDGCYEVYYGSTENHKAKLIAKIKKVLPGQNIQYYFANNLPDNITHFKIHSCSGELLTEEPINDTNDGTITDSNGNYTIKLELDKVSIISVKTPTKDYGEIKIDLRTKTTGELVQEFQSDPSLLPITTSTTIQTTVVVSVVTETISMVSGVTIQTTSTNTGSSIDPTILIETAKAETITPTTPSDTTNTTNTTVTLPSVTYSSNSYTFTKDLLVSTITPTIIGTVTSCSISPVLPAGLSLDSTTCAISGTPTVLQAATDYTITATNISGSTQATISITVNDSPPSALSYGGTPYLFTNGMTISTTSPTISGTPTSYSISPALPTGLTFDTSTGQITGSPTGYGTASGWGSNQTYTVTATNTGGSTQATITIAVTAMALHYPMSYSGGDTPSTVLDKSGHGANGTVNGGAVMGMDYTHTMGEAYKFDGVNDYISFSAANLPKGNAPRTMCVWEKPNSLPSIWAIVDYGSTIVGQGFGLAVGSNYYRFYGWGNDMDITAKVIPGKWTHLCGWYDGTTAKLYVDGKMIGSSARAWNTQGNTGYIGVNLNNTDMRFNGNIDDIRIYDRVLTDAEIKLVAAKVPNGLVAYYPLDGDANDVVGTNHGTVNGATLTTDRFGNANSAYNFNGSQGIDTTSAIGITGAAPRTLSFWMQAVNTTPSTYSHIVNWGTVGPGQAFGVMIGTSPYYIWFYGDQGAYDISSGIVVSNIWDHWTYTYDGTKLTIYKNGSQISATNKTLNTGNSVLKFGKSLQDIKWYTGKLDDVRIYNRALSATEVAALGAEPERGMVAYYPLDGNANDVVGTNHGTVYGGATLTTDRFGNANSAYNFVAANSQYIETVANVGITGASVRTLAFWVKAANFYESYANTPVFWGGSSCNNDYFGFSWYAGSNIAWGCGGGNDIAFGATSTSWEHYAFTYTGTNIEIYRDGALISSTVKTRNTTDSHLFLGKVVGANGYTNGTLDDVRIYNRVLSAQEIAWLFSSDQFYYSDGPIVLSKNIIGTTQAPKDTIGSTTYTISPALPTGLSINSSTGVISGTATNYGSGSSLVPVNYTVTATNSYGTTTVPLSLAIGGGQSFWIKADAGVYSDAGTTPAANGVAVQQWNDQSGNAAGLNVTQATPAGRPLFITNAINGKPVVRFDGVDDYLSKASVLGSSVFATNETNVFVVWKQDGTQTMNTMFCWEPVDTSNRFVFDLSYNDSLYFSYPNVTVADGATRGRIQSAQPANWDNNFHITELHRDTSTTSNADSITVDGTVLATANLKANLDNSVSTTLYISSWKTTSSYIKGDIAEILFFNRGLTSTERKQVQCYLAGKYGITVSGTCP